MITLGLVDSVDDNGVYVTMPGSRGVLRGPYKTLSTVAAGTTVLVASTDDGEQVVVGAINGMNDVHNVRAFGAVGDGTTDDTTAIQAAIDAASAVYGEVYVPAGVYRISSLDLKSISALRGQAGMKIMNRGAFGDSSWALSDPAFLNSAGTVFRSTATTGAALNLDGRGASDSSAGLLLDGFAVIGPGSGTSSGFTTANTLNAVGLAVSNVMICNFATGWTLDAVYESLFERAGAIGCTTGILLTNTSNQNTLVQTEVQLCGTGVEVASCDVNLFAGGLGQSNSGKSVYVHGAGCHGNVFDSWYFENEGSDIAVHFESDFNEIRNGHGSWSGSDDDRIVVDGNHCVILNTHSMPVEINGYNCITLGTHAALTGTGLGDPGFHVDFTGARMLARGLDVRIDSGRAIYLEDVGTNSYIKRDASTGDTHIGPSLSVRGPVGFNSTAPLAKPTVTGSRGGNAALASLLAALANYGLITDSTS